MDRAGSDYWSDIWRGYTAAGPDPATAPLTHHHLRRQHEAFERLLRPYRGGRVIEVGCAGSLFVPYFERHLGMEAWGLDYSAVGCERLRAQLPPALGERIVCADLFALPPELEHRFDAVVSLGVIEHFEEPETFVAALARLVKPGGLVITFLPNLVGLNGWLMKTFNPGLYALHVPLSRERVARAHAALRMRECGYFMGTSFGVLNETTIRSQAYGLLLGLAHRILRRVSFTAWWLESRLGRLPATRLLAPYILCAAVAPGEREPQGERQQPEQPR